MRYVLILLLFFVSVPKNVYCPEHGYASCFYTGGIKQAADGGLLYKFHCTCGDDWWVRGT